MLDADQRPRCTGDFQKVHGQDRHGSWFLSAHATGHGLLASQQGQVRLQRTPQCAPEWDLPSLRQRRKQLSSISWLHSRFDLAPAMSWRAQSELAPQPWHVRQRALHESAEMSRCLRQLIAPVANASQEVRYPQLWLAQMMCIADVAGVAVRSARLRPDRRQPKALSSAQAACARSTGDSAAHCRRIECDQVAKPPA